MLARAITAFVALPGMVAFAVPITIGISAGHPLRHIGLGLVPLALGTLLLLWCVREFYVAGRGTLAPWAPPERLVTSGPYRFSRNPMYIAVGAILVGWCTLWASHTLIIYTAVVLCAVYLRVRLAEEPWAARRFGAQWEAYRECVPRWLI
jgi:protein-S-isoprenylcysteine O-methyltransferase Ste14